MLYRINKSNYHDFDTIEINKLPARSYFIPFANREQASSADGASKRYSSPKVICLNGDWDFKFYDKPSNLPDNLDTDRISFAKIDVPSCWQFRGYDRPFYVNTRYQFPYDPPKIPEEDKVGKTFFWVGADKGARPVWADPGEEYNFVGVYRTFFNTVGDGKRHVLSFLGVASCADVYVNGKFVGYSEGSHNTAEFDVTPYIKPSNSASGKEGTSQAADNELVVVVHRWCNGTYLECQDMFRNNGIFRDVLLRVSEDTDIRDIDFQTMAGSGGYRATATASVYSDTEVKFTIEGMGVKKEMTVNSRNGVAEAKFFNIDALEWNAEVPTLYDLYIETPTDCVKTRVGFKNVKITGTNFTLNGRKIKFHGVNHHDTSSTNGYTLTPEEIERDMKLCKEYNIDTVRTSHYPPDPYLLEVCDELGIYVVDEFDLEAHGTYSMKLPPSYNRISSDPKWGEHYMDRARRMYQRDKLHPSIVMWSLGNESGGYENTDKMAAYIKSQSMLPIHYESAIHSKRKAYDIASEMYPPVDRVHKIGEKKYKVRELIDRPYFLCEYAHAMGVGPGDMEAYWREIYKYDNLIGGCVWEMVDHAVLHKDGSYTYGGDHEEWEHDGNFCVDGMFYPDRTPSTGAVITKFIYRPIRVRYVGGDVFEAFNTRAFTSAIEFELKCKWSDGTEEAKFTLAEPLSTSQFRLETSSHIEAARKNNRDCLLTITTIDTRTGEEVGREQIIIEENFRKVPEDAGTMPIPDIMQFDFKSRKELLKVGDVLLTPGEPHTILWRAPMDNDFVMFGLRNIMKGYLDESEKVLTDERGSNRIKVSSIIKCGRKEFICTDTYEACEDGKSILVTSKLHCEKGRGDIPRFGKSFKLSDDFTEVEYYGRNGESYADMKDQFQIEEVKCKVSDMTEPNIRPQESGNRYDTRWVSLSNGKQKITFEAVGKAFELGIKPYSDVELLDMKHREDEKVSGTYITLSAFQRGVGTGICGPETAPEYCYSAENDYELQFIIRSENIE